MKIKKISNTGILLLELDISCYEEVALFWGWLAVDAAAAEHGVRHDLCACDEEAAALLTTSESVLRVLRKQNAGKVEEKKSLSPL